MRGSDEIETATLTTVASFSSYVGAIVCSVLHICTAAICIRVVASADRGFEFVILDPTFQHTAWRLRHEAHQIRGDMLHITKNVYLNTVNMRECNNVGTN